MYKYVSVKKAEIKRQNLKKFISVQFVYKILKIPYLRVHVLNSAIQPFYIKS